MNYIIDGHNLIAKIPGLDLGMPDDEQRLIELLIRLGEQGKHRMEVYFDRAPIGQAGAQSYGRVKAHFVQHKATADEAIRRKLGELARSSKNWVVVSSDRGVQAAAHEAQARVMSSEDFARYVEATLLKAKPGSEEPAASKPLSEAEVREWEAIFRGRNKQ